MKSIICAVVYIAPFIFLLLGIIADFTVIPVVYGIEGSFMFHLFVNPKKTIYSIINPHNMLPEISRTTRIIVQMLGVIWGVCFWASLYFFCRKLGSKSKPAAANAILIKKEPYLLIMDVSRALRQLRKYRDNVELNKLIYAVKCLEEKMATESDFGYGNDEVIACENEIIQQFQFLLYMVMNTDEGSMDENIYKLNKAVENARFLLMKRTELKKLQ